MWKFFMEICDKQEGPLSLWITYFYGTGPDRCAHIQTPGPLLNRRLKYNTSENTGRIQY